MQCFWGARRVWGEGRGSAGLSLPVFLLTQAKYLTKKTQAASVEAVKMLDEILLQLCVSAWGWLGNQAPLGESALFLRWGSSLECQVAKPPSPAPNFPLSTPYGEAYHSPAPNPSPGI